MWAVQTKLRVIADSAALAGAGALARGSANSNADTAASTFAASNAYTASGQTSSVTINIPPVAPSAFVGETGCVQAVVQFNQPAGFSAIWGAQTLPVTVRAVARGPDALLERRHPPASARGYRDDTFGHDAGDRRQRQYHGRFDLIFVDRIVGDVFDRRAG